MTLTFDLLTSESIDVLLGYWATHILSLNQIEPAELELLRSQGNYATWSCDLDLLTSKSIGVFLECRITHILSFNQIEPVELELLRSQGNYAIWSCDLDLSPFDLKIKRYLPLALGHTHTKFESN